MFKATGWLAHSFVQQQMQITCSTPSCCYASGLKAKQSISTRHQEKERRGTQVPHKNTQLFWLCMNTKGAKGKIMTAGPNLKFLDTACSPDEHNQRYNFWQWSIKIREHCWRESVLGSLHNAAFQNAVSLATRLAFHFLYVEIHLTPFKI